MRCLIVVAMTTLLPTALQAQWAPRGDHEELRGMTVVDLGTFRLETRGSVRVFRRPERGAIETRSVWVFEGHERRCFNPDFGMELPESETALFLSNEKGEPFLAVVTTSGEALSVQVRPAVLALCPPSADSSDSNSTRDAT